MDILKTFKLYDKDFPVNVIGSVEDPLFQANHIGALLGIKQVSSSISNYDNTMKTTKFINTQGGRQKVIFLTEFGLYNLIFKSRKPAACEVQKWILNIIKQIRLNSVYRLTNQSEIDKNLNERQQELERHKSLLLSFGNKQVIYICALDNFQNINNTNKNIYKIGWSNNFAKRLPELENAYGPVTLLHMFQCEYNSDFEYDLFQTVLLPHHYNQPLVEGTTRETFLLSSEFLKCTVQYIKENLMNYQVHEPQYTSEEMIILKELSKEKKEAELQRKRELYEDDNISISSFDSELPYEPPTEEEIYDEFLSDEEVEYEWNEDDTLFDVRQISNIRSPWVQKYDPVTFELVETSDSLSEFLRANINLSYSGLKQAAERNTIYKGYRWLLVDKDKPNIKYELNETQPIINTNPNSLIAKINICGTKIVEVYPSQKYAAIANKFNSYSEMSKALAKSRLARGYYWKRYDDCSVELKSTFNKQLPQKLKRNNGGKKVNLIHKNTKQIVKTYDSVSDVLKEFQMSRVTLKKICDNKEVYKNWLFEII